MRQELRDANTVLTDHVATLSGRVARLTKDNAKVHNEVHDLRNEVFVLTNNLGMAVEDREECRTELRELLERVLRLEEGTA